MKVKINREELPNCTTVWKSIDFQAYHWSLISMISLSSLSIVPNVLLCITILFASRVSNNLRWLLANTSMALLTIAAHFIVRCVNRLIEVHSDVHFCKMVKSPLVTPSSCMLEEAPWTAALFFVNFIPIWLTFDRLVCSSVKLRRAKNLGKIGCGVQWCLGWLCAILLIVGSRDFNNIHYCHNLFPFNEFNRNVWLWGTLGSSLVVLVTYSFVSYSNGQMVNRAMNQAIFYNHARIQILDTISVNRALFPAILVHIMVFSPTAVGFFYIQSLHNIKQQQNQNDKNAPPHYQTGGDFGKFALINSTYSAVLLFGLLFPMILLVVSRELQGTLTVICRKFVDFVKVHTGLRKEEDEDDVMLPGEYESAMSALFQSTMFGIRVANQYNYHDSSTNNHSSSAASLHRHHRSGLVQHGIVPAIDYYQPHEPEDEDGYL